MPKRAFTSDLEKAAREIIERKEDAIPRVLQKEIALTLEQLDSEKKLHNQQMQEISNTESMLNTELMSINMRTPHYSTQRYPEEEKTLRKLLQLGSEKRRIEVQHRGNMQSLETQLLSLLNQHGQINGE